MSAANIYNGVAMVFGNQDVAIGTIASQIGTLSLQNWDYAVGGDTDEVRDPAGNMQTMTHYNPNQRATFRYFVKGSGLANALTQVLVPTKGTIATITSTALASLGLAATNWQVMASKANATNTKNIEVTLDLAAYPNITAAAPA
jgi:hypothetical protein